MTKMLTNSSSCHGYFAATSNLDHSINQLSNYFKTNIFFSCGCNIIILVNVLYFRLKLLYSKARSLASCLMADSHSVEKKVIRGICDVHSLWHLLTCAQKATGRSNTTFIATKYTQVAAIELYDDSRIQSCDCRKAPCTSRAPPTLEELMYLIIIHCKYRNLKHQCYCGAWLRLTPIIIRLLVLQDIRIFRVFHDNWIWLHDFYRTTSATFPIPTN